MRIFLFLILILAGCTPSKKSQLNIFVWSEYFSPQVIDAFEREYNCNVVIDTYDTNEAMYAKLKLGASGYDIILPSNYVFDILVEQNMLYPIDYKQMTNMRFFQRDEAQNLGVEPTPHGMPFVVSYTGLGYRKDRFEDFHPSWTIFDNPELRGRITMLNDLREVIGAALLTLGYSINTTNPSELNQAVDLILKWKKNLAKFESEQYKNGLASSEYLISQAYNSDVLQVALEEQVGFAFPKEGAIYSIDYIAIPSTAPNPSLAQAFINFLLRPHVASLNMNYSLTASFVEFDRQLIKPILNDNSILHPPLDIIQKSQLLKNVGEAIELYNNAWERILTEN